jgi:hypothetical protein
MTLSDFLLARYDEDEAVAREAGGSPWKPFPRWVAGETNNAGIRREDGVPVAGHSWPREMEHIARFDPVRILAEIAAKRAIVAHETSRSMPTVLDGLAVWVQITDTPVLRMLAQPYADHPDFDPVWSI